MGFLCLKEAWEQCAYWKHLAQSFRGHRSLQERQQNVPQTLWGIRRLVISEGALPSLLEQDRTSTGNPYKNMDHHFTTETAAKKKVPIADGDPVCYVLKKQGKGLFLFSS